MNQNSFLLTLHQLGAYLFVLVFMLAVFSGIWGLVRKDEKWLRRGAWAFVAAFFCLGIPYLSGFTLKAQLLAQADETLKAIVQKHHDLSKFVLTGTILTFGACAAMLKKYRSDTPLPGWLWPNLLFISWMVVTFIIRSLLQAYRIP